MADPDRIGEVGDAVHRALPKVADPIKARNDKKAATHLEDRALPVVYLTN